MIAKVEGDEEGMSRQTEGMRNVLQDLGSCGLDDVSVNKNFNKKSLTLKCQFLVCFESCLDCHKGLGINGRQTPAGTIELILHGGVCSLKTLSRMAVRHTLEDPANGGRAKRESQGRSCRGVLRGRHCRRLCKGEL